MYTYIYIHTYICIYIYIICIYICDMGHICRIFWCFWCLIENVVPLIPLDLDPDFAMTFPQVVGEIDQARPGEARHPTITPGYSPRFDDFASDDIVFCVINHGFYWCKNIGLILWDDLSEKIVIFIGFVDETWFTLMDLWVYRCVWNWGIPVYHPIHGNSSKNMRFKTSHFFRYAIFGHTHICI